jgi:hypothetical protein
MVIPFQTGVDTYRLKWATNFDASPTQFIDSTRSGFTDPAVAGNQHVPLPGAHARVVFDPSTYSISTNDDTAFWLVFVPVTAGSEGTPTAPMLVLPALDTSTPVITIRGTAPNQTSLAASLRIDFPRLMTDLRVRNENGSAHDLFVATDASGAEINLSPDPQPDILSVLGNFSSLYVRGSGASVVFSATFTFAFPK